MLRLEWSILETTHIKWHMIYIWTSSKIDLHFGKQMSVLYPTWHMASDVQWTLPTIDWHQIILARCYLIHFYSERKQSWDCDDSCWNFLFNSGSAIYEIWPEHQ